MILAMHTYKYTMTNEAHLFSLQPDALSATRETQLDNEQQIDKWKLELIQEERKEYQWTDSNYQRKTHQKS